jgi:hypothetical protein
LELFTTKDDYYTTMYHNSILINNTFRQEQNVNKKYFLKYTDNYGLTRGNIKDLYSMAAAEREAFQENRSFFLHQPAQSKIILTMAFYMG